MFIVLIRTIILYFVVVISMRIMGKRQIGQLQPFELAIAIMASELASLPMQDTRIPLIYGIIPIFTLIILQVGISILQIKSEKLRGVICGTPSILIDKGSINIKELKRQKFSISDLFEELRLQGYYDIEDIEYAILETSGQLSIIPKTDLSMITKKDMNIKCDQDVLPVTLITDGKINKDNLKIINKDLNWFYLLLKQNNIADPKDVFIGIMSSKNTFYYQLNDTKK